ncbi:hypothetical protein EXIGLDRAFT_305655 [Exidia glandulosa HHB12029]|uniref:Uncharacterized protein n=1 Tax=Exidia glandulosa HHB12029 TaxID=1314781 RepID=A0A165D4C5_EXIGL|nr:hypothetical protein EXIGLDRAFT_305655 [Exidia glandulosa HHB12029]
MRSSGLLRRALRHGHYIRTTLVTIDAPNALLTGDHVQRVDLPYLTRAWLWILVLVLCRTAVQSAELLVVKCAFSEQTSSRLALFMNTLDHLRETRRIHRFRYFASPALHSESLTQYFSPSFLRLKTCRRMRQGQATFASKRSNRSRMLLDLFTSYVRPLVLSCWVGAAPDSTGSSIRDVNTGCSTIPESPSSSKSLTRCCLAAQQLHCRQIGSHLHFLSRKCSTDYRGV